VGVIERQVRQFLAARAVADFGGGLVEGAVAVAVLAGGALRGGRVIADWPGLKAANLYEERDLKPTIDLRAVLKGVLKDHLRLDERALATRVFPGSSEVRPTAGLLA